MPLKTPRKATSWNQPTLLTEEDDVSGPVVVAVHASRSHKFSKEPKSFLTLLAGLGVQGEPLSPISAEVQTRAAQAVGRKNLSELEGLSVDGARLTKLLLSLGRVFGVLAESPAGHTPEANQFHLREEQASDSDGKAMDLLKHSVMHLALVRYAGSKLLDERDTKAYDYMIHPIFAPFFVFSHRKKRKILLSTANLLSLVDKPREGIEAVLKLNHRDSEAELPDQMQLFGDFYA